MFRFIPAAVTPLKMVTLINALLNKDKDKLKKFKHILSIYFNKEETYTFSSLMRTNYACIKGLKELRPNKNKVLVPRYVCPSFLHGIVASEAEIIFCDLEYESISVHNSHIEEILKSNDDILALVLPNLFGLSSPVDKLKDMCKKYDVLLVEGVDYGIGSEISTQRIGTFGDVAILNFQEGKAIPIGGGAIVSSLDCYKVFENRNQIKPNYLTMFGYRFASNPFGYFIFMMITKLIKINRKKFSMEDTIRDTNSETDFKFDYNEKLLEVSNFQASIGIDILEDMERHILDRKIRALEYEKLLSNVESIKILKKENNLNKIHYIRYPIFVEDNKRDLVLKELLSNNIEASPMYIEHGMNIDKSLYPNSHKVMTNILTLPVHKYLTHDDIHRCVNIIKKICQG